MRWPKNTAYLHVAIHDWAQRCRLHVRHRFGHDPAAAFLDAEHDGFVIRAAPNRARHVAADIGFVHLDMALHHLEAVGLFHQLADLLAHAPCGFVRDA
jgi:hypothetical protein